MIQTTPAKTIIELERVEGDAYELVHRLTGRCRGEADLADLRTRANQLAELSAAGDVYVVWGREVDVFSSAATPRPIAMGGVVMIGLRVAELWGVVADDLDAGERIALAKMLARTVPLLARARELQRIQATARSTDVKACRTLEALRMSYEGTLAAYGPAGESHAMYAYVPGKAAAEKGGA